jgi:hypothetical protein
LSIVAVLFGTTAARTNAVRPYGVGNDDRFKCVAPQNIQTIHRRDEPLFVLADVVPKGIAFDRIQQIAIVPINRPPKNTQKR